MHRLSLHRSAGEEKCAFCGQIVRWFSPPVHLPVAPLMSLPQVGLNVETETSLMNRSLKDRGCVATGILFSLVLFGICWRSAPSLLPGLYAGLPVAIILALLFYKVNGIRNMAFARLAWVKQGFHALGQQTRGTWLLQLYFTCFLCGVCHLPSYSPRHRSRQMSAQLRSQRQASSPTSLR